MAEQHVGRTSDHYKVHRVIPSQRPDLEKLPPDDVPDFDRDEPDGTPPDAERRRPERGHRAL